MVCSLFGHRYFDDDITDKLTETAERLVVRNKADCFYVGNQGKFDSVAMDVLMKLNEKYSHIRCYVVPAYFKAYNDDFSLKHSLEAIYPAEVLMAPHELAIPARNKWMVRQSDCVLCFVTHDGGAASAVNYAKGLNKTVVNIAQFLQIH